MNEPETVLIPDWLTKDRFGCNKQAYFDTYIKGQRLPVEQVYGKIYVLRDANNQQWTLHETDLILDKSEAENQDYAWMPKNDTPSIKY